jgi:hypothetical protein
MSTQTEMAPESVAAEKPPSTYIVQMFDQVTTTVGAGSGTAEKECWIDIARVTVPQRTPRKIVLRKALEQSGLRPGEDQRPLRLRALDEASAMEQPAEPFQPEPEWRVGS